MAFEKTRRRFAEKSGTLEYPPWFRIGFRHNHDRTRFRISG